MRTRFDLTLSNLNWRLKLQSVEDAKRPLENSEEAGFDGTNVFKVFDDPTFHKTNSQGVAYIGSDDLFPHVLSPSSRIVWLALGSRAFWRGVEKGTITAPWMSTRMGYPLQFNVVEWLQGSGLPKRIIFQHTAPVAIQGTQPARRVNTNYLAGEYNVISSTNLHNCTLPLEFEVIRYFTPRRDTEIRMARTVMNRYSGTVLSCKVEPALERVLPKLSRDTRVYDHRLSESNLDVIAVQYISTNGTFPDRNDPRLLALLKKKINQAEKNKLAREAARPPGFRPFHVLFIFILLSPLLVIFYGKIKRKTERTVT
jgi:hypothetical protein